MTDVGTRMPERVIGPITRTDLVRYAGAAGDMNPIHHDEEFARSAGQPSVFAHGLLTGGMLAAQVAGWLGAANVRSLSLRFTGRVLPGDTLALEGVVEEIDEVAGERIAKCALRVVRQTGEDALRAVATAVVT
ncbi:MAG TPA: MaoC/PaaZ C-terminal domain-containing protein [Solirubrobacteraceae bacterium]|jgi:acyl dehydratase|nr:MaoC/PaaZ C-terminal domain-containing protein [Solirubrobacteraceae bacterium]